MTNREFHIISAGYNCENYVVPCYQSILKTSSNHNIHWWICDDASKDSTHQIITGLQPPPNISIHLFRNDTNMGSAYSRFVLIKHITKMCNHYDIAIQLDLDDYFLGNIFNGLLKVYNNNPSCMATFGSFKSDYGVKIRNYTPNELNIRSYLARNINACWKPPRSFCAGMLHNIRYKDIFYRNKMLRCATDVALTLPIVTKLTSHNIALLADFYYFYRKRPDSTDKVNKNRTAVFEGLKADWKNYLKLHPPEKIDYNNVHM